MSEYLWLPDNGDGTYRNPIVFCDYSDPDCICVDGVYYMTASTFNYVPGLPILVSHDLINWKLVNYALKNVPVERFSAPCHAHGVWAPAIRYHDGFFYIYYGQPDEGIYMVRTADPLGEWDEPVLVLPGKGLIDPCPFWDEDGHAYVIHGYAKSRIGFKSWLGIFPISWDGTKAIGDDKLLYDGVVKYPTIEGPKVHKRDGWYYIFAPAGGVVTGWQVVLRSRSIYGPYEDRVVLRQGSSETNGPHQGAWIETPEGENWFMHFQSRGLYGRITHLQPMHWQEDGWPWMGQADPAPVDPSAIAAGEDAAAAALEANAVECGVPVDVWPKPKAPEAAERTGEIGTDDFTGKLGLQWQFMGNWRPDFYDCGEGKLRLYARALPNHGTKLWECPQTCTQKIACPAFCATTTVDVSGLKTGEQAGVGLVGGQYAYAALRRTEEGLSLVYVSSDGKEHTETIAEEITGLPEAPVSFRMTLLPTGYAEAVTTFEYAVGGTYRPIGEPFAPARHTWVGARLALFAMPLNGAADQGGYAEFGEFVVEPVETLL
ncbi:MAG: glycoside hydrolase 43 family protein [Clostridia bacterium]|nr:glycoside hydrolase 43 family protein [Clostridia bacterium]